VTQFILTMIFIFLEKMAAVVDNLAKNKRHFFLVSFPNGLLSDLIFLCSWELFSLTA
jgi:hypothetical protein